ncbi:MAG: type II toxin-antitoxin system RelE/ParE family toxin [Arachidicoccus sp.]|nr:type II toxin-antitoxin system RelE/ParE family toxin [Arachidicoccus sp.]
MYRLEIQSEAMLEMQQAYDWYEFQKNNLGNELLNEIENCFQKLEQYPHHYTKLNEYYRRIRTNRFPYLLIFEIEEKTKIIFIISLFHTSRKPKRKYPSKK